MNLTYSIFKKRGSRPNYLKTKHSTLSQNTLRLCLFVAISPLYIDYKYKIRGFLLFFVNMSRRKTLIFNFHHLFQSEKVDFKLFIE